MNINSLAGIFASQSPTSTVPMPESSQPDSRVLAAQKVAAVQDYLDKSPLLAGSRIQCMADEEQIILSGYVSTYSTKHAARVLAERVAGEVRIEDRLDVIPIPPE